MRRGIDPQTKREVCVLTDLPQGALVGYFRHEKLLPDGRVLVTSLVDNEKYRTAQWLALDPQTGAMERMPLDCVGYLRLRAADGMCWYSKVNAGVSELWRVKLPGGSAEKVHELPPAPDPKCYRSIADVTCDGQTILWCDYHAEEPFSIPTGMDAAELWRYIRRPRHGSLYARNIATGDDEVLVSFDKTWPFHVEASPADPTVVRIAQDVLECAGQRMFRVRIGHPPAQPLRMQELGEMITHEFWWSDPNYVGYTYMDRRGDPTVEGTPWCEYATCPTQLGICDLTGREVFRSEPLGCYHAHLYMSPDGQYIFGEGTVGDNHVFVGRFAWQSPRIDMVRMATIHTPWIPTRGQTVNACFTRDSRYLLYNDTVDGKFQICRVAVDV